MVSWSTTRSWDAGSSHAHQSLEIARPDPDRRDLIDCLRMPDDPGLDMAELTDSLRTALGIEASSFAFLPSHDLAVARLTGRAGTPPVEVRQRRLPRGQWTCPRETR